MRRWTPSDVWLLVLALAGGFVDATSYIGLGRVFTANMTGNTVLLTVALARGSGGDAARSAVALGGFCLGVACAVALISDSDLPWPRRARGGLLFELLALLAWVLLWALVGLHPLKYVLIAIAGMAMGAQSASVRASHVSGVNTTYMTSTLLNAIARLVQRARGTPEQRRSPGLPGAAWVTYGLGALAGAFAVLAWHAEAVIVPLAIICAISAAAGLTRRRERWSS